MLATQRKAAPAFRKTAETFAAEAKALAQQYFVSPEVFAEEQDRIFSKQWVLVGHQRQLAEAGDYFVAVVASESLIIVRDKGGELHGFYNVCRHRGTRLREDRNGHLSAIQCPYHAWTYALDGRLIGAPHMDDVPGFDKSDYPLHRVNLAVWEGFIFVNLAEAGSLPSSCISATSRSARPLPRGGTGHVAVPDSSILSHSHSSALTGASRPSLPAGKERDRRKPDGFVSLEDWFAPLQGKFSHWNMSILQPAKRIEYDVCANWKLMFENYSECYHCPGVHPQLQKVSPYDSAENDLREGPFLGGFMKINLGKSLTMSGNACAAFVGKIENLQQVFYYSIFPNMLLSLHPEYVMVHQLWPQSPERTLIVCDWLFHPDAFGRKDFRPEDAIEFWDMTNKQDWHVCELSQQGIASRAYEPGPYSARESIPAAWDEYYLRRMKT
ncbi:MAG TPA: SRPBCC family protein [Candidatus Acidoferrum sp.]|jgi:phenylpropionate dioxygenase-like ring-hydroxylating dioxygenase large terminal subunit|nr:SRPBCC family protein [Candidatus Acidoferrum sp.]